MSTTLTPAPPPVLTAPREAPAGPARRHAIELMDLPFWPGVLRDGATDYLQALTCHLRAFEVALPALREALLQTRSRRIVDLCSGGSGPWPTLLPALQESLGDEVEVLLTDLYPNRAAAERCRELPGVSYEERPVDALNVPPELEGVRAIVNGLHHFRREEARELLREAVRGGQPVLVLELLQRTWRDLLSVLIVPLSVLLTVPRIPRVRLSTLLFTYLIPILPLAIAFDTLVSTLRCYRPEELLEMVEGAGDYEWRAEATRCEAGLPVTYLVGYPRGA